MANTGDPTCRFCDECGAILPFPDVINKCVVCVVCNRRWPSKGNADGPEVDRVCSKCENDKMCYSTRQTRSADEGQTVFFTCQKCGHKDIEYS